MAAGGARRARRALHAGAAWAFLTCVAPACSSGNAAPNDTCAFLDDPNNCYHKLVAAIDDCLTDVGVDAGTPSIAGGTLSADGMSCTYSSGRKVTFVGDARQYDAAKTPLDVTVSLGGKTCVHYTAQPMSSITVTGPDGATLRVTTGGTGETIACPDGSQHAVDALTLFSGSGCGDGGLLLGGGLPGTITSSGTAVSGGLVGAKKQAYNCRP
jgi:hypothetical protein